MKSTNWTIKFYLNVIVMIFLFYTLDEGIEGYAWPQYGLYDTETMQPYNYSGLSYADMSQPSNEWYPNYSEESSSPSMHYPVFNSLIYQNWLGYFNYMLYYNQIF